MPNRGKFIGNDNLYVPDAPTIGTATGDDQSLSVTFTAPSDVGNDDITAYGASATDGTNVIGATGSSSPVTVTGLTNGTSYTAQVWAINDYGNGPLSAASNSVTAALDVAFVKTADNDIEKFNISTTGNATDFAHASNDERPTAGFGNDVYAFWAGGNITTIDRLTNASGGTATDFGDLTQSTARSCGISNNVRGMIVGGDRASPDNFTVLEYVTMATTGNATDFGDTNVAARDVYGLGKGSTTRGVFGAAGDDPGSGGPTDAMSYITIASAGNSIDFGNLTVARIRGAAGNNSTRIVFSGGQVGNEVATNVMDYITIASTGNATDFGDTTETRMNLGGASNSTRSVFTGGAATSNRNTRKNTIDYITTATTGNATDFGDLVAVMEYTTANSSSNPSQQNESYFAPAAMGLYAGGHPYQTAIVYLNIATDGELGLFGDLTVGRSSNVNGTMSSTTRGLFAGGNDGSSHLNVIDFVSFSTKGKATDFGNLTTTNIDGACFSSSTRGVVAGGDRVGDGSSSDIVDYVTIASAGNATDFGDMTTATQQLGSTSNTTRGLVAGGTTAGGLTNTIEYFTIASTGDATDFGDLTEARRVTPAGVSSSTRAVFAAGLASSASNVMDYVTIGSTGNATDFGDLTVVGYYHAALSDKTTGLYTAIGTGGTGIAIDKITIASTGNATDWGDNLHSHYAAASASNSHGGIA